MAPWPIPGVLGHEGAGIVEKVGSMVHGIKPGDRVYWLTTGAYTASYCAVCFNGFPPLKTYFVK